MQGLEPTYAKLGEFIATWNGLEWDLVDLLQDLSSDKTLAHVVGAHISSAPLCDIIRALASSRLKPDLAVHVVRAADVFEKLRERRNQFVHRVTAIMETSDGAVGYTYGVRAKKSKLMQDSGSIETAEIDYTMAQSSELSLYLVWVRAHVRWFFDSADDPPRAFRAHPRDCDLMPLPRDLPSRWGDWRRVD